MIPLILGIFSNLDSGLTAVGGGDTGTQFFGQAQVGLDTQFLGFLLLAKVRRLHEQRGKGTMKSIGQPGGSTDHLGVGGAPERQIMMCSPVLLFFST